MAKILLKNTASEIDILDFKTEYGQNCHQARNYDMKIIETNDAFYALEPNEKLSNGEIIDLKETPEYQSELLAKHKAEFQTNFIELSLGCLRKKPKGYTSITEAMNCAFNIVSVMNKLPADTLTFYPKPDFSQVEDVESYLETNLFKNQEMTTAEFNDFYVEFQTVWNQQEHL